MAWIRILRKNSWEDLNEISTLILTLRKEQEIYEKQYISDNNDHPHATAMRLVALYHWAKATECLAKFMLQGEPGAISAELDQHFEAAYKAAEASKDQQFEMLLHWLHVTSRQMVAGSVWWVAHTVNSRVSSYVKTATKTRGLFELFPPQRYALNEGGLLNQAHRAVVVEMPTSAGKTELAVFRILQALNQFSEDDGWVAYIAPTRALVSQITRRLRKNLAPNIKVELLSGAVEVDSFEEDLLSQKKAFHILVATPEKLQLVIRNKKINRPLALVVMDEAHNIEDKSRGLRIELLLATIKQECTRANFLLLMPYVPNTKDIANWLGEDGRGAAISLSSTPWQPNERIIGLFNVEKNTTRGDWSLNFETLITTHNTISLRGKHVVSQTRPFKKVTLSQAKRLGIQAAAMAKIFSEKGTSIVVAQKIDDTWSLARKLQKEMPILKNIPNEITLVQRFLKTEISEDFELIDMLSRGIAVHNGGLSTEVLSLIEWLTENEYIKILCATTTIAQGLNFPVSSVFLATYKHPYGVEMSPRAFWNLAGRAAGRVDHGSVGVVGIAAGNNELEIRQYVSSATGNLISRLVTMLDELETRGKDFDLSLHIHEEEWTDFRSYLAHLWNEKKNLDIAITEAEQLLRNTYGYRTLRGNSDSNSKEKAKAILAVTKTYIRELSKNPENATLADTTGFSPEGVRAALLGLHHLDNKLQTKDWQPDSLFGNNTNSILPDLVGIMMKIPQLKEGLEEIKGEGTKLKNIAEITNAWVAGKSIEEIAKSYFEGKTSTEQISKACKTIYKTLANNGAWGLSALSKMPTSGLDFDKMSEDEKRRINNLPAMIYHGVFSDEAILMRMNFVPRSISETLGNEFKTKEIYTEKSSTLAGEFLAKLKTTDWDRLKPSTAAMSGADYQTIWKRLAGLD